MISILIPTRGRTESLKRTIQSARDTANAPEEIEICIYIDDDDIASRECEWPKEWNIRIAIGKRIILGNMWNKCAAIASGDILCQGNDDIIFRTKGWDTLVEKEFSKVPDRLVMVHGQDGSGGASGSIGTFGVHPFVSRRWYEVLGYVTPPYFSSDFCDTWINHIANAVDRRRYIPTILIEHMHYWWGKMPLDANTEDRLKRHNNDKVELLYRNLGALREIDVEKMEKAIERKMVDSSFDTTEPA